MSEDPLSLVWRNDRETGGRGGDETFEVPLSPTQTYGRKNYESYIVRESFANNLLTYLVGLVSR